MTNLGEFTTFAERLARLLEAEGNVAFSMKPSRLSGETLVTVSTADRRRTMITADAEREQSTLPSHTIVARMLGQALREVADD